MGDALITTDNKVLLENTRDLPAIMCVQRKAEKKLITEELLVEANKNSFGDEIGTTTNHVTAMYDLLPLFDKDSEEYRTLEYRIMSGQLYQQNRYGPRSQKCVRKEIYRISGILKGDKTTARHLEWCECESSESRKNLSHSIWSNPKCRNNRKSAAKSERKSSTTISKGRVELQAIGSSKW